MSLLAKLVPLIMMFCVSLVYGNVFRMNYPIEKENSSDLCYKTPPSVCYNASQSQPIYEFLLFSQEWPGSFCLAHKCTQAAKHLGWNIHGLWPSEEKESKSPCYCPGPPFSAAKINSLNSDLNTYWSDLMGKGDDFYVHEWCKHGRCFKTNSDELTYFNVTLTLRKKIDLSEILQNGNIVPSQNVTYTRDDVINVLTNSFKVTPNIMCTKYKDLCLLQEIHICLDPQLKSFVNCPQATLDANCNDEIYYYPNSM